MPGCYFHIDGTEFNPDEFLSQSSFRPYRVWHVGEKISPVGPRSTRVFSDGGFRCNVSDVDGDLSGQIADAISFMHKFCKDLEALTTISVIETRLFDFGFDCRLNETDVGLQGEYLPIEFLDLVAKFRIGVALSLYPALKKSITE